MKVSSAWCWSVPHLWSLNTIIERATHCPCHNNINSLPSVLAPDWLSRPRLGCYLRSDWSTPALRRRCSWLSSPSHPPRHFCICTLSVNITPHPTQQWLFCRVQRSPSTGWWWLVAHYHISQMTSQVLSAADSKSIFFVKFSDLGYVCMLWGSFHHILSNVFLFGFFLWKV